MTREESAEERTAGRRLQPSHVFFFSCRCFCFLWMKWGKTRTDPSLLLFGDYNISVQCFEAVAIFRGLEEYPHFHKRSIYKQKIHNAAPNVGATRSSQLDMTGGVPDKNQAQQKTFYISGQLVRARCIVFLRTEIRPASTCHNKLQRGKVLPSLTLDFGPLAT